GGPAGQTQALAAQLDLADRGPGADRRLAAAAARTGTVARARPGGRHRGTGAAPRRPCHRLPAGRSPCHPRADRPRRPVPVPAGRHGVPEPRGTAAAASARLLPRVHRGNAGAGPPRRAAHRHRRRSAARVVLHRRPLPQLPGVRARGPSMTGIDLGALLADPARAGTCFADAGERAALAEAAAALDFAVATVDLGQAGCKHALLDALAAALGFPPTFGRNWDALADGLGDLSWLPAGGYML